MEKTNWLNFNWILVLAITAVLISGCAGMKSDTGAGDLPDVFACTADKNLEKIIAPEAEVEEFSCSMKKWEGADTLHFKVAVKNVSDSPQRYRVNIFMENGKAVGGLIPRKTAKGLVEPGQSASFTYPVKGVSSPGGDMLLRIATIK